MIFFRFKEHQSTSLKAAGGSRAQVRHISAPPEITHKKTGNGVIKGRDDNTVLYLVGNLSESDFSIDWEFNSTLSTRNAKEFHWFVLTIYW